jgi:mannose-6-phosphate isomerase-like protein (cupin superfamily)
MQEQITHNSQIYAIIVKSDFSNDGITFFTPDDYSQQLACMNHPRGKIIRPHVHNKIKREIFYTREVIFIKKGKIRADFYTDEKKYFCSKILETGDFLLLVSGGHGFEMLEDTQMFEIKQGPYAGENDKTRFDGIDNRDIIIKEAK